MSSPGWSAETFQARTSGDRQRALAAPVPCLTLLSEPMVVDRGGILSPDYQELDVPLIRLAFDYGGVRVRAADPLDRIFLPASSARNKSRNVRSPSPRTTTSTSSEGSSQASGARLGS